MIVPELEGIASDVETLWQEIAEIRGMFDEQSMSMWMIFRLSPASGGSGERD